MVNELMSDYCKEGYLALRHPIANGVTANLDSFRQLLGITPLDLQGARGRGVMKYRLVLSGFHRDGNRQHSKQVHN